MSICQSMGIFMVFSPMRSTNAGALKLSKKIKGMK
jgi:hypothetical protein